jgi:hypothetical protein
MRRLVFFVIVRSVFQTGRPFYRPTTVPKIEVHFTSLSKLIDTNKGSACQCPSLLTPIKRLSLPVAATRAPAASNKMRSSCRLALY